MSFTPLIVDKQLSIVEASIEDLRQALASGRTTSVELVARYLNRIALYDRRGLHLNAVPVLNQYVFEEAAKSDLARAIATEPLGLLEGIPCTIKDSFKVRGMTVAAGSPAFRNLIPNGDAFTVQQIRGAGAVIIGKTNMPPMAAGGMQRGVYGRAESPYNSKYLTAAFASGSSNGSATSTAASFATFGMGEETISSGRSPASNNGLVAYTPSRGVISIRGNWPLFPTCDVVVPHTRTVSDMFDLLDVIVKPDVTTAGDFWRDQEHVPMPDVGAFRPRSYHDLRDNDSLSGKKIGVPKMYIGGKDSSPNAEPVHTRESVITLWKIARATLESLGATVVEVDFPVVTEYEKHATFTNKQGGIPAEWNEVDTTLMMAYAWDDFLIGNQDPAIPSLSAVDSKAIFPHPPGALPDRYTSTDPLKRHEEVVDMTVSRTSMRDIPGMKTVLLALEKARKETFEAWLESEGLAAVVFPANGDVGEANADIDEKAAQDAWRNGVKYSNGNCPIRHLGIPTVNVPMGVMADIGMPVNLTFASKAYDDNNLFRYAYAYERASMNRMAPGLTPVLSSDVIPLKTHLKGAFSPPLLTVEESIITVEDGKILRLKGTIMTSDGSGISSLTVHVDGVAVQDVVVRNGVWEASTEITSISTGRPEEGGTPSTDKTMVVVLACSGGGGATGKLLFTA